MPRHYSLRYWLLFAGASVWTLLVFFPPLLNRLGWTDGYYVYLFFSPICHQMPERSIWLYGRPLAVCARCTGLYVGFWSGVLFFPLLHRLGGLLVERPRLMILFWIPMAIDLLVANTATSRFLTGWLAAFPVALFVWIAVEQIQIAEPHHTCRRNL